MSNKSVRNIYKRFENLSDPCAQRHTNHRRGDLPNIPSRDEMYVNLITDQIHAAISSLQSYGWLDIEEFRLPSQYLDIRALFFRLDELIEQEPGCISHQKEIVSMQRDELRPLLEEAISIWGPPPVQTD